MTKIAAWDDVAAAWNRHYEWHARCFAPLNGWFCDAVALVSGTRVLDIGCGTGLPALSLAERAYPNGFIDAIDSSLAMLHAAERRAAASGVRNIAFHAMDAEALGFANNSFDAVTCAFGLMFCPDPIRAVREMRRILKPGGRFAIAVWNKPSQNPFLSVFGRPVAEMLQLIKPEAHAPGPFRFAPEGALGDVLKIGGFSAFELENRPFEIAYDSIDSYIAISGDLAPGLRARLGALAPQEFEHLESLVRQAATPYLQHGRLILSASPLCAYGRA